MGQGHEYLPGASAASNSGRGIALAVSWTMRPHIRYPAMPLHDCTEASAVPGHHSQEQGAPWCAALRRAYQDY